jgi:peptidoglycan/xylan/chitin deacetylase (PgdA/CDA1 family)
VDRRLRNRSRQATFLCYHSVAPAGAPFLTVSERQFEAQLTELRRRGLRSGDLNGLAALAAGERIEPAAFLTFDDGFRDNYETVLPMLRERGETAFVFVLPPLLDDGAAFEWPEMVEETRRHPATMRSVTWRMVEAMKEGGFEIGSHTMTHPHLPLLDGEALREELWDSRARIKERLGVCDVLAYPFGDWSRAVAAAAADCGYRYAFSLPTKTGQRAADRHSIPRINVDFRDRGWRFAAKLSPAGRSALLSPEVTAARRLPRRLRRR